VVASVDICQVPWGPFHWIVQSDDDPCKETVYNAADVTA
jgi:hypothetical protein